MGQNNAKPSLHSLRLRRRIERALGGEAFRDTEAYYRALADATPVMMWRAGPDRRCTYVNSACLEFTGRTIERELDHGWLAGVHPDDRSRCLETYNSAFDQRQAFAIEYRLRHCSGEYRWILDRGAPLYSPRNTFMGYIGACIDIHDRKRTEQELSSKGTTVRSHGVQPGDECDKRRGVPDNVAFQRGPEWYKRIIDTTPDAVISVNWQGRIVLFNPAAERIFGYARREIEGQKVSMLVPEMETGERDFYTGSHDRSDSRSIDGVRTTEGRRKNGEMFPVELSLAEFKIDKDICYAAFIRDISDRRQMEQEVQTCARQQAAVAELGRWALSVGDVRVLTHEACVLVSHTLGTEFSKVLQLLPDGQAFCLEEGVGWKEGMIGKAIVPACAESQAGYTLLTGEAVVVEDLSREKRFKGWALLHEHGVISGLSIVIRGRDRPFGVLSTHTAAWRKFTDKDVCFLEGIANVLSEAIARCRTEEALRNSQEKLRALAVRLQMTSQEELRALAVRLQVAREEERASLAREIHDEISGGMAALKMNLALLHDRAANHDDLFVEKLRSMTAHIDGMLGRMHAIVTGLRPVVLDKFGLVAALEWQTREFQQRSGIICESDLPEETLELDSGRSTAIFRILQEALTNVVRHAAATKVTVTLKSEAEDVVLVVRDDGKGIDENSIRSPASLGLIGMRERALAFGGALEVGRLPEGGTQLVVKIPRS